MYELLIEAVATGLRDGDWHSSRRIRLGERGALTIRGAAIARGWCKSAGGEAHRVRIGRCGGLRISARSLPVETSARRWLAAKRRASPVEP